MNRPDLPAVMPPPYLYARMVGASVLLAAVAREPLKFRAHYLDFIELGKDVACGVNRWTTPACEPVEELVAATIPG
jgi:hypothetical protein